MKHLQTDRIPAWIADFYGIPRSSLVGNEERECASEAKYGPSRDETPTTSTSSHFDQNEDGYGECRNPQCGLQMALFEPKEA